MRRFTAFRCWMIVLVLAIGGCQGSVLEEAEGKLATFQRTLKIKHGIHKRVSREIETEENPSLLKALQEKQAECQKEIDALTSDIELQKEKIATLKESD